jgi:asparagine synthase (glutamine-hydrolysing)
MCGIVGAVDLEGERIFERSRLLRMVRALAHRGPDGEGLHIEAGVALAARRLALVDVQGGAQPVSNEDGSIWAVFNGELFDDDALRRDLVGRGHSLRSRCDTELWPHLYEQHGEGLLDVAHGQFAVAIWDRAERSLLLARDRFGVRPLYFAQGDGWLLWGSEVKALLASGMVPARLDARGLDHVFTFFSAGAPRTLFEGVQAIEPGAWARVRRGGVRHARYWDMGFPAMGSERRESSATGLVDELESHLSRAVSRRLRGDVPVACYLSGGLDSSLVLAMASRLRGEPLPAFAIAFDGAGPDERRKSASTAAALGAPLETIVLDHAAICDAFPGAVSAAEEPIIDTSNGCLLRLAERVSRRGFKTVLSGEGADEAFAGYAWYKVDQCLRALSPLGIDTIPAVLRWSAGALIGGRRGEAPRALAGARSVQDDIREALAQGREVVYSEGLWERIGDYSPLDEVHLSPDLQRWHPLHQAMYVDYKRMLPGHLLAGKGDRVAMAHAVETRYPFLDHDLVVFSASLAPHYKLRGLTGKWLLRKLAERYLPRAIAARPKTMLRADRARSLLGPHRPAWVNELLSRESLAKTGLFKPAAVAREVARQMSIPTILPRRWVLDATLTAVVSTQLLHHLFFGGGLCQLPTWAPPEP